MRKPRTETKTLAEIEDEWSKADNKGKAKIVWERWVSEAEWKEVRRLYNAGLNDRQIAEKVHHNIRTIFDWRKRNQLPQQGIGLSKAEEDQRKALYDSGLSDYKIAKALNTSPHTISNWRYARRLVAHFKPFCSPEEQKKGKARSKQILRLFKRGKKADEIAQELDLDYRTVSTVVGFHLMKLCRKEPACPYKALLPETNSEVGV